MTLTYNPESDTLKIGETCYADGAKLLESLQLLYLAKTRVSSATLSVEV